ncbi:HD domain-containing phosphohydrolase [Halioxenophilus aromaticivorans]|uniref:Response regulator n=1 Tax=Halioxenophilus aromaticivorans TaxID=1306992 RepID=A0AAV3U120_9ALTE
MTDQTKILIVDDEKMVLDGLKDVLRKHYNVHTALSAKDAITLLEQSGPYAVVISDMIMPDIDGAQFLTEVRERFPHSVRILLTGQANAEESARAVNDGGVYRFLMKPCDTDKLLDILADACVKYQRNVAESEIIKTTLFASMEVMSEALSIMNPMAFSRGGRLRQVVASLAKMAKVREPWMFEIAAMLSQLGCVTCPPDLLEKVYLREKLNANEKYQYENHPEAAYQLLHKIPRMEQVALMIRNQNHPEEPAADEGREAKPMSDETHLGARFLYVAGHYDDLRMQGISHKPAIEKLHQHFKGKYGIYIDALKKAGAAVNNILIPKSIEISDLVPGMILAEDVHSQTDLLLMAQGQKMTSTAVGRLLGFHERIGVREPFTVLVRKT